MKSDINAQILALIEQSPNSVLADIAVRAKARRLEMNLTQKALASRAGISLSAYRRFESTGEIPLSKLLKISMALGSLGDFDYLFSQKRYESFSDAIQKKEESPRKRGRRND